MALVLLAMMEIPSSSYGAAVVGAAVDFRVGYGVFSDTASPALPYLKHFSL